MTFPTQSQTLDRMESETRKDMRRFEDSGNVEFLKLWANARQDLKAIIAREYIQDFGTAAWDIATAAQKNTLDRIDKSVTERLSHFNNESYNFIKNVLPMVTHLEICGHCG